MIGKEDIKIQETNAIFEKQLTTLENVHSQLTDKHKEQQRNVDIQKKQFRSEINRLKKEFSEIETLCQELNKHIFLLGNSLKRKITTFELQTLEEFVNTKTYEEYIRYNELEQTFNRYAKQK
jgi:archaellum component FlaC